MSYHTSRFDIRTPSHSAMIDITSRVQEVLAATGIRQGLVTIHIPHTTAAVTINENADPDVIHDMLAALDRAVPWRQDFYRHSEGNSAAHVKSSMVGCTTTIPLADGKPALGTWQGIYFCEFDGPRTRQVVVAICGQ